MTASYDQVGLAGPFSTVQGVGDLLDGLMVSTWQVGMGCLD
jgi:hypothetical protein